MNPNRVRAVHKPTLRYIAKWLKRKRCCRDLRWLLHKYVYDALWHEENDNRRNKVGVRPPPNNGYLPQPAWVYALRWHVICVGNAAHPYSHLKRCPTSCPWGPCGRRRCFIFFGRQHKFRWLIDLHTRAQTYRTWQVILNVFCRILESATG